MADRLNTNWMVPAKMREEILENIHEAHMGLHEQSNECARDVSLWTGKATPIEEVVQKCAVCNKKRQSQGAFDTTCSSY